MRIAEIVMAIVLASLSLAIMYKAGERPDWSGEPRFANIFFGEDGAPKGGFWPFWVCAILFVSAIWVLVRGILRLSPPARSTEPYLDRHGLLVLASVALPVFLLVALSPIISMYAAMALFLLYYSAVLGRHGVILSLALALVFPFWMFLFFDIAMTETLPKGLRAIDDAFYAPVGTYLRGLGGTAIALLFVAGAVVLGGAVWASRRLARQG